MGICLALNSVSDRHIESILETPELIWALLAPEEEHFIEAAPSSKGFFARFFRNTAASKKVLPSFQFSVGENIETDLDKAWHGLHYCINQTHLDADPPMDFIMSGGALAGSVDVGYGPARLFNSETVKDIYHHLLNISVEDLKKNYAPVEMEKLDIYPTIWESEQEEGFEYLADYYASLKSFLSECVEHQLGMAVYFC